MDGALVTRCINLRPKAFACGRARWDKGLQLGAYSPERRKMYWRWQLMMWRNHKTFQACVSLKATYLGEMLSPVWRWHELGCPLNLRLVCKLGCRLSNAALGGERCDGNCHDQLRNTVTVHIRSRHIDSVSGRNLERFGMISTIPDELKSPAFYHYALAEVRNTFLSAMPNLIQQWRGIHQSVSNVPITCSLY